MVPPTSGLSPVIIEPNIASGDPRADDINGEFFSGVGYGLHLVDMTLAMGDLVALGASQAQAWLQDQ
jgi:hypothetical protein